MMPAATAREAPKFVRRTTLGANEYHTNFRKVDCDTISRLTSEEATRVTSQMCKVYLSLLNAPPSCWERDGVLRFAGEEREGEWVTAWGQLVSLAGVASATARKALQWMHEQGIIGYFAGKNGVGIRVFLNRAFSSIGTRVAGQKILEFPHASSRGARTSTDEAAFSDSYADLEVSEIDLNPRAPKDGAETTPVGKPPSAAIRPLTPVIRTSHGHGEKERLSARQDSVSVEEVVERLRGELEPRLREAAARAAAQSAAREMERTREWFEAKALPKAVRVAQRETYDLLRKHGGVEGSRRPAGAGLEVGRGAGDYTATARPLTPEEIRETAEMCVALLEAQGKSIEVTLSEISSVRGGWLLPEDAARVREAARELALSQGEEGDE